MKTHPAETTTGAAALALLVGLLAGLDAEVVAVAGVVLGFVPAGVTWLVNAGGVKGVARKVWQGR